LKIKSKFLILFLIISLIPLLSFLVINYTFAEAELQSLIIDRLDSTASILELEIHDTINDKIAQHNLVSSRTQLRLSLDQFLIDSNSNDSEKINKILMDAKNSVNTFSKISIIDEKHTTIFSTNKSQLGKTIYSFDTFHKTSENNVDVIKNQKDSLILVTTGPLYLNDNFLGQLVIEQSADAILTSDYTGMGDTGEFLLGKLDKNGDIIIMSPGRFDPNIAMNKIISKENTDNYFVKTIIDQEEGQIIGIKDYRGNEVTASIRYLDDVNWGLVVKMNNEEAYGTLNGLRNVTITLGILIPFAAIFTSIIFSRNISAPISNLIKLTKKIEKGEKYEQVIPKDEFGELTKSMLKMDNTLKIESHDLKNIKIALDEASLVAITDLDGKIIFVNDKFCETSKYTKEELIGQNHRILKSDEHSDDYYKKLWDTISKGNTWRGDMKNKAKDGSFYWVKTVIMPIENNQGTHSGYIAVRTNITSQKKLEKSLEKHDELLQNKIDELKLELLEKQKKVIKAEKFAVIGEFSSRLAHDLRNPLSVIKMTIENMKLMYGDSEKQKTQYEKLDRSINRITHQVDGVLGFIQHKPLSVHRTQTSKIILNATESLIIPENVEMILPTNDIEIFCDEHQMSLAMNNLILNAIQSIDKKGLVEIRVTENDESISFFVRDSGNGVKSEDQSKIFEPLFTTKQHGTGLGLASVKSIITAHKGTISAEFYPTLFTIRLPKNIDTEKSL